MCEKANGKIRLCCDYKVINSHTKLDEEPLPNPEDLFLKLQKAKIFSKCDLARGFWQIPLTDRCKQFTAFKTHQGLYTWNVMPFG